jgi:hypothetical protein
MNFLTDNKRLLKEENTSKYLDRLRQQYESISKKQTVDSWSTNIMHYTAMRLFCLDCELVSFNEVELMEYEVNSSF